MKIDFIEYENTTIGLKIEKTIFNNDLTLLVGLSGSGKTQILKAIDGSFALGSGEVTEHHKCNGTLGFTINGNSFVWEYKADSIFSDEGKPQVFFDYEKLTCGDTIIFARTPEGVYLKNYNKIPMPKSEESIISLYRNEEILSDIFTAFRHNCKKDFENTNNIIPISTYKKIKNIARTKGNAAAVEYVCNKSSNMFLCLCVIKLCDEQLFNEIFEAYNNIFQEVSDIIFREEKYTNRVIMSFLINNNEICIYDISSGMLKTLAHIVRLFLCGNNKLILIDELENGLGINCMGIINELISTQREDFQFIITSHHPYIINNIPMDKWLVVLREKNKVKAYTAKELKLGKSHHESYMQLMNMLENYGDN